MIGLSTFTDAGPRRENQDRTLDLQRDGSTIFGVADGLGGHTGGALAAQIIVDVFTEVKLETPKELTKTLEKAHERILRAQTENYSQRDMGSTATIAMIFEGKLFGVHVGDTRCALQRGDGIIRLTQEHTEANRFLASGKLTKDEYANYPRKNVLDNALGIKQNFWIEQFEYDLNKNDKVIITSDGVHDKIKLREMLPLIKDEHKSESLIEKIVAEVEHRIPTDNFSIVAAVI